MFLADLKTENEKEAFVNLAYLVAKADGCLGYGKQALINLYLEEMGMNQLGYCPHQVPMNDLCHVFSNQRSKQIVFANLLSLSLVDRYDNEVQECILEVIQRELTISSIEAKKYEDEMKILMGCYFPDYLD